ncbi:MAG: sigma 54-interacting transcriptional regulator, partial [Lachnospiraceae bacterium]|nr:sigma 54-interacting transcriptional regulator [Lachnospiraceae bacterium]
RRGLEEKRGVRVGASRAIDVDVRVIAATKQELDSLVEAGTFREDLYYRLHVLPLEIPPLRERREDILPIFYSMAHRENPRLVLLPETAEILKNYSWKGNVRELRNVVEFVLTREKDRIDPTCLPPLAMHPAPVQAKAEVVQETLPESSDEERREFRSFLLQEGNNLGLYQVMLQKLHESSQKNERYGRQRLLEKIREDSGLYTEGEVRRALSRLSQQGFVRSSRGRGGSVITEKGRRLLREIEMWRDR